jgi:hypothetical protein
MSWLLLLSSALAVGQIHISGAVRHSGSGPVRVEVLQVQDEGPVLLVAEVLLPRPNADFDLVVPANLGRVLIRAAADPDMDGVGESDPQVVYPRDLELGRQDIRGIELNLVQMEQR